MMLSLTTQDEPSQFASLRDMMPEWMLRTEFLIETWQWLGILGLAFVGMILEKIVTYSLRGGLQRTLKKFDVEVEREVLHSGSRPFGILAMALAWMGGLALLSLPEKPDWILDFAARTVAVAACVMGAYRLVDVLSAFLEKRASKTDSKFDDLLIPLIRKTLKLFIGVFGIVFIASNIPDLDISSMLAGLGLGGLAFALAAKDTVANFFGSLTVILDRPFQVGDWVVIGDAEGTVTDVGFRSTRIRTFYNSVITVPNSNLITAKVDNLGARQYRRWKSMLGVTYDTSPEKLDAFCEGIRELIRLHPYTRKDYFHVYVNGLGASSIDILLYIFHEAPDWSTELRERHRMIVDIVRLAQRMGVELAFPTQTIHMLQPEPAPQGAPGLPIKEETERVLADGREEARKITEGGLGGLDVIPPPVTFTIPKTENRGELDEEDGDEGGGE